MMNAVVRTCTSTCTCASTSTSTSSGFGFGFGAKSGPSTSSGFGAKSGTSTSTCTSTSKRHLSVLLLMIILLFSGISCTDLSEFDKSQVKSAMLDSLVTTSESWDVEMTLFKDKKAQLRVYASKAVTYQMPARKEISFEGPVTVILFDKMKNEPDPSAEALSHTEPLEAATVRSGRALYREQAGEFELFDDVQVETRENRNLRSSYLKWSDAANRIQSPEFVTITSPTDSISGYGFEGAMDLSEYTITKPRGRVLIDSSEESP